MVEMTQIAQIADTLQGEYGGLFASGLFTGFVIGCAFYQKFVGKKDIESIARLEARTTGMHRTCPRTAAAASFGKTLAADTAAAWPYRRSCTR